MGMHMKRARTKTTSHEPAIEKKAASTKSQGIEKLIHFIWAGGDDAMPEDSTHIVNAWAKANKDFNVVIWVDARALMSEDLDNDGLEELFWEYQNIFKLRGIDVFLNNVPNNYPRETKNSAPIIIRDITQHQVINEFVRYEIDKVAPNYGSSSDILRYHILYRYGGVYIDSDVAPGPDSLLSCDLFTKLPESHQLYLDHVSQKVNPPEILFDVFELFYPIEVQSDPQIIYDPIPGNDSFICTVGNPLMYEIIRCTENNYRLTELNDVKKYIMAAYGSVNILTQTLDRTGTIPVITALSASKPLNMSSKYQMTCLDQKIHVLPLRQRGRMLTQPVKNSRKWIKQPRWDKINKDTLMKQLLYQTNQEIKFFGILRLCDHLHYLREFANENQVNPEQIIKEYLRRLEEGGLPLNKIKVAQLISLDPLVLAFYQKHNLLKHTLLMKGVDQLYSTEICELMTSKAKFTTLVNNIKRFGPKFIQDVYQTQGDIYHLHHMLKTAVEFIELLQSDPEKFARMFTDDRMACLQQIKLIVSCMEDKFSDLDSDFDFERVNRMLEAYSEEDKYDEDLADAMQIIRQHMYTGNVEEETPEKPEDGPEEQTDFGPTGGGKGIK